jgi:hypothetical protein
MKALRMLGALTALGLLLIPGTSGAVPTYKIKGNVIANGGAWGFNATQGSIGTAGQSITGWSSKLYFSACSGFWCFGGARVVGVDGDGGGDGATPGSGIPNELTFGAPSPNPSRGEVRFALGLPKPAEVTFAVFDVAGRQIGEPVVTHLAAGQHQLRWSAPADHSGVYFGVLRVNGAVSGERRIVLVR